MRVGYVLPVIVAAVTVTVSPLAFASADKIEDARTTLKQDARQVGQTIARDSKEVGHVVARDSKA
ncbi:MAG: hypothetical protein ACRETD_08120, partial [Steroidobacteraceae bacterium]